MPALQLCVSRNTTLWEKMCLVMGYNSATKPSCPMVAVSHNAHLGYATYNVGFSRNFGSKSVRIKS